MLAFLNIFQLLELPFSAHNKVFKFLTCRLMAKKRATDLKSAALITLSVLKSYMGRIYLLNGDHILNRTFRSQAHLLVEMHLWRLTLKT